MTHPFRSIASTVVFNLVYLLGAVALSAQTFTGADDFNDNVLTVGTDQRWRFDVELNGSGTAYTEQNQRMEFTSSEATGWNTRVLGWISPSSSDGVYGKDWSATVKADNHTTPGTGFTYAGFEAYTLLDLGGEAGVSNNAYYGIYLDKDATSGTRIVAEWGRWNAIKQDFDRKPVYITVGSTTQVVLNLTWHASTQQLVASYSLDGGETFRAAKTFSLSGAEAGLGAPYADGVGLELTGVADNAGVVASGQIYFDNMSVVLEEPVDSPIYGSDNFDDNTLTVGIGERWRFNTTNSGAGGTFTETSGHLEFTTSATNGTNVQALGWTSPSASAGSYDLNWKARVTVSNLATPTTGFVQGGMEAYILADQGGAGITNSAYYAIYVGSVAGSGKRVIAEWSRWNAAANNGAGGWTRSSSYVPIASGAGVVVQLSWDAVTEVMTAAFSLDGGVKFATARTFSLANTEAGIAPPYANGFGIEFDGIAGNTGAVAAGMVTFDDMIVTASKPVPVVVEQPASQAAEAGGTIELTTGSNDAGAVVQWQVNGEDITGGDGSSLTLTDIAPADAGLYSAVIANGDATTTSAAAIIGVSTNEKVIGDGDQVGADLVHPNGNVFDQVLVTGEAEAVTSDYETNKITRTSFIDDNGDIVQVEFSGPGTLTLRLNDATGPANPEKYTQAVDYMKGHAAIVITGADERSNLLIFTVGRATAFDPTGHYNILLPISETNDPAANGSPLFAGQDETVYDGFADIAFVAIASTNEKFGAVRTANVRYTASRGYTGIYAPGVEFQGPVFAGEIEAFGTAVPELVLGSASDVRITGGSLFQDNGEPVAISGIEQLKFSAGSDSAGNLYPAQVNQALLLQDGTDVTDGIVVNPE